MKPFLILIIFLLSFSMVFAVEVTNFEVYELGDDGFVIGWQTDVPSTSQVLYGLSGRLGNSVAIDSTLKTDHQVQVSNLDDDTVYFFRATGANSRGEAYYSAIGVTKTTINHNDNSDDQVVIDELKAFPTALGFGKYASGGRGGAILYVTNLNDRGQGSLRNAIEANGKRIIIFRVGGSIELDSELIVRNGDLTIAGETAPGDGIELQGATLDIQASNVIVRNIRVRPGSNQEGMDGIGIHAYGGNTVRDVIIDHSSVYWADDENVDFGSGDSASWVTDSTIQNSIIAQGINNPYGLLLWENARRISIIQNLFAHNHQRNIESTVCKNSFEMVNNVIYGAWSRTGFSYENVADIIGNAYVSNPNTPISNFGTVFTYDANWNCPGNDASKTRVYISDNREDGQSIFIPNDVQSRRVNSRVVDSDSLVLPYSQVQSTVLSNVGAFPLDSLDARTINEVKTRTGTRGYQPSLRPNLQSGSAYPDTDRDGMSDTWEQQHGFIVGVADHNGDHDGDGYTNVEEFLHSLMGESHTSSSSPPAIQPPTNQNLGEPVLLFRVESKNIGLSSFDVEFEADRAMNTFIRYGTSLSNLNQQTSQRATVTSATISVTGLEEGTRYYYQIVGEDSFGNVLNSRIRDITTLALTTNSPVAPPTNAPPTSTSDANTIFTPSAKAELQRRLTDGYRTSSRHDDDFENMRSEVAAFNANPIESRLTEYFPLVNQRIPEFGRRPNSAYDRINTDIYRTGPGAPQFKPMERPFLAAIYAYLTDDVTTANNVMNELIWLANNDDVDPSNGRSKTNNKHGTFERWPDDVWITNPPFFTMFSYVGKWMEAYELVKDLETVSNSNDRARVQQWFKDFEVYGREKSTFLLNSNLGNNWRSGNMRLPYGENEINFAGVSSRPVQSRIGSTDNRYIIGSFQNIFNNRMTGVVEYVHGYGISFNDQEAKDYGEDYFREYFKWMVFSDGTNAELYRSNADLPERGVVYHWVSATHLTKMAHRHAVAVENGLPSVAGEPAGKLFEYTTTQGILAGSTTYSNSPYQGSSTTDGSTPKGLGMYVRTIPNYYRPSRYGGWTDVRYNSGVSIDGGRILKYTAPGAYVNLWYNDQELKEYYRMDTSQGYPVYSPDYIGEWGRDVGPWGTLYGVGFWSDMENVFFS